MVGAVAGVFRTSSVGSYTSLYMMISVLVVNNRYFYFSWNKLRYPCYVLLYKSFISINWCACAHVSVEQLIVDSTAWETGYNCCCIWVKLLYRYINWMRCEHHPSQRGDDSCCSVAEDSQCSLPTELWCVETLHQRMTTQTSKASWCGACTHKVASGYTWLWPVDQVETLYTAREQLIYLLSNQLEDWSHIL